MQLLPYETVMQTLRERRRDLDVTQRRVASEAGISPAHLSRMEQGAAHAKYSSVYAVYEVLERLSTAERETARDVMTRDVLTVDPEAAVRTAVRQMLDNAFSQVPVTDGGAVVGTVTDRRLMAVDDHATPVRDHMEEPLLTVRPDTGRAALAELLGGDEGALLVTEDGEMVGLVTPADLL